MNDERYEIYEPEEIEVNDIVEAGELVANEIESIAEVCNCEKLNVRTLPDISSEIVRVLNKGELVITKTDTVAEWAAVEFGQYNEWSGYCLTKYLRIIPVEG